MQKLSIRFLTLLIMGSILISLSGCAILDLLLDMNQEPIAVIDASITDGEAPLTVNFDGTGSSDPDGSITDYSWEFGDGNSGSGTTISHTYEAEGGFTATLTVTDDGGLSAQDSMLITVTSPSTYPQVTLKHGEFFIFDLGQKTTEYGDGSGLDLEETPFAYQEDQTWVEQNGLRGVASGTYVVRCGNIPLEDVGNCPIPSDPVSPVVAAVDETYLVKTHTGEFAGLKVLSTPDLNTVTFEYIYPLA